MSNKLRNFLKIDTKGKNEIIRFCIAGTIVTATDFSIYYVLFHFLPFSVSKGISFTCAGIVGYFLCKYWIFKHKEPSITEVIRYAFINSLALGINVFINHLMLRQWPGAVFVALIIATSITGLFTFVCFKWWVFRSFLKEEDYFRWWKWLPWRYLVRNCRSAQGFLDPIKFIISITEFCTTFRGSSSNGIITFRCCLTCAWFDQ